MIQLYVLSIVLNSLAGYILISGDDKNAPEVKIGFSLKDETVRLILGILSMATGVLKILSPVKADGNIIILGDLFPAIIGFAAGAILCLNYRKNNADTSEDGEKSSARGFLLRNKKAIGFTAIGAAVVHFFFYGILFL